MNIIGLFILAIALLGGLVCLFIKRLRIPALVILLCSGTFAAWQWQKEAEWENNFERVPSGASIQQVIDMLGTPSIISNPSNPPFGYSLKNKDVKKELWYVSFYLPHQFTFGFDEHDRLIDRYHFVSP
mgnify:CR=1 FL=1